MGFAGFAAELPAICLVAVLVALASAVPAHMTLSELWTGKRGWRALFGTYGDMRSYHYEDLVRPSWIRGTVRATGWHPLTVGVALAGVAVIDVAILVAIVLQYR